MEVVGISGKLIRADGTMEFWWNGVNYHNVIPEQLIDAEIASKINEVQSYVAGMVDSMKGIYENAEEQSRISTTVGDLLGKLLDAAMVANDVSRNMAKTPFSYSQYFKCKGQK